MLQLYFRNAGLTLILCFSNDQWPSSSLCVNAGFMENKPWAQ